MIEKKKKFAEAVKDRFVNDLKTSKGICYVAGTGSGKSYWVKNVLTKKGDVLFVTSRRAKANEDLVDDKKFERNPINFFLEYEKDALIVTNSMLAKFIKSYFNLNSNKEFQSQKDDFELLIIQRFKYIVIDEAHSLACDATFSDDVFIIKKFVEYTAFELEIPTILLTATPEPIKDYLKNFSYVNLKRKTCKWQYVPELANECDWVLPKLVWIFESEQFKQIIENQNIKDVKKIYFSNSASRNSDLYLKCIDILGEDHVAIIMSDKSQKDFYKELKEKKEEELNKEKSNKNEINKNVKIFLDKVKKISSETQAELTENQKLPDNIKILLTTSKLKEGINLQNLDIPYVFCESHDYSDIIQYIGRVRKGVNAFFIISDAQQYKSQINHIEKNFSDEYIVRDCNKYYNKLNDINDKKKFIDYVENKFIYIRFNWIERTFEMFDLKYSRQKELELIEKSGYKSIRKVKDFCASQGIPLYDYKQAFGTKEQKEAVRNYIMNSAKKKLETEYLNKKIFNEDKADFFKTFNDAYNYGRKSINQFSKIDKMQFEYTIIGGEKYKDINPNTKERTRYHMLVKKSEQNSGQF